MKRVMGWFVLSALVGWSLPASADVANDDCGTKAVGDTCETFSGDTGVCVEEQDDYLVCDTDGAPATDGGSGSGGSAGSKDDDDDDEGGCSVRNAGAGGRGEAAALGLLLLACIALRKRFD